MGRVGKVKWLRFLLLAAVVHCVLVMLTELAWSDSLWYVAATTPVLALGITCVAFAAAKLVACVGENRAARMIGVGVIVLCIGGIVAFRMIPPDLQGAASDSVVVLIMFSAAGIPQAIKAQRGIAKADSDPEPSPGMDKKAEGDITDYDSSK